MFNSPLWCLLCCLTGESGSDLASGEALGISQASMRPDAAASGAL